MSTWDAPTAEQAAAFEDEMKALHAIMLQALVWDMLAEIRYGYASRALH